MNYILISDYLWYLGHVLTGCSVLFDKDKYYVLVVSFVIIGQFITIISRPISRIKNQVHVEGLNL